MKRPMLTAAVALATALGALAAAPALASDREQTREWRSGRHDDRDRHDNRDRRGRDSREDRRGDHRDWRSDRRESRDWRGHERREDRRIYRNGYQDGYSSGYRDTWRRDQHNGYYYRDRWAWGAPPSAYSRDPYYRPGYRPLERGRPIPHGYRVYGVDDFYRYGLYRPPRDCRWVRDDRGEFFLIGVATGIILDSVFRY